MVTISQARAKFQTSSPFSCLRRNQTFQVVILSLCLSLLFTTLFIQLIPYTDLNFEADVPGVRSSSSADTLHTLVNSTEPPPNDDAHEEPDLKKDFDTWFQHLRKTEGGIYTRRTACRELEAMAQTCVYEGIVCMNTSKHNQRGRPYLVFVDDEKPDRKEVPTDNWCGYRYQAADPRYYSSRHWPPWTDTVVPQHSCMEAWYRTSESLFGSNSSTTHPKMPKVKWLPSVTLLDFDFMDNDHNGHFASDTLWVLDAILFQKSLDVQNRPGYKKKRADGDEDTNFILPDSKFYFPHSRKQFEHLTGRDVNRLLFATIIQKDLRRLYPDLSDEELYSKPPPEKHRFTSSLLTAYPELNDVLHFHGDYQEDDETDLVCTPHLAAGFKSGFSMHERACRHIRTKALELFKIPRAPMARVGQIFFPQPPKSIMVLNRHQTRRIGNHNELMKGLKAKFEPMGVNVTYLDTSRLETAEEFVRVYSEPGIMISPHGSQNMAQMFMQRYATMIEIMPVGYTEFSFNMLSIPCKTFFYEFHSMAIAKDRPKYEEKCGHKAPHMFQPCIDYKSENVWVNVTKLIPVILDALEHMGYHTGHIWFEDLYKPKVQQEGK